MNNMSSMERVLTTLSGKEPDRVPLFFLFTSYGAKEFGMDPKDYFEDIELIVKAQFLMQQKYRTDCITGFLYASIEYEAFGGSTKFIDDGPPNAGEPIIHSVEDINNLQVPIISQCEGLKRVLSITKKLKWEAGNQTPIIGVVIAPGSMPIMQMGFEQYIKLLYEDKESVKKLLKINQEFAVEWANEQLEAGATAICYFNPIASAEMLQKEVYKTCCFEIDKETIEQINGPTATHLASAKALPTLDLIEETGTEIVAINANESIAKVKESSGLTVLGNLSGINMCHFELEEVEREIKRICEDGMKGGRFILSDNHGEIPWQVPAEVLLACATSIDKWGKYS